MNTISSINEGSCSYCHKVHFSKIQFRYMSSISLVAVAEKVYSVVETYCTIFTQ
ncbi:MAG: hypothetical protein H6Q68_355 [Firmicutes bacterium]|nr:hypothetical protein [Bacillota bacterium]